VTMMSLARKASKAAVTPMGLPARRRPGDVVILLYHRIGRSRSEIEVDADVFESHLEDLAAMFQHAVENPVSGAWNGVAPIPVSNADFTRVLAGALHRPAIFPVPAFALRLLFGEMSEILLGSQRVAPAAAEAAGFRFRFPELSGALENVLAG